MCGRIHLAVSDDDHSCWDELVFLLISRVLDCVIFSPFWNIDFLYIALFLEGSMSYFFLYVRREDDSFRGVEGGVFLHCYLLFPQLVLVDEFSRFFLSSDFADEGTFSVEAGFGSGLGHQRLLANGLVFSLAFADRRILCGRKSPCCFCSLRAVRSL